MNQWPRLVAGMGASATCFDGWKDTANLFDKDISYAVGRLCESIEWLEFTP